MGDVGAARYKPALHPSSPTISVLWVMGMGMGMGNVNDNPLFHLGTKQEQIIMARLRMRSSDLKDHLHSMKIIESSACSCSFKNQDEIHFFLACPLYYRPRVTLLNALAHIAPLTVRTLLYGNDTFEFEENKIIITETLRLIKESKRFDWCYIYLNYQFCCV